jgi:uncharacterized protein (DUF58 family)
MGSLSPDLALLRWALVWLGAAVVSVPWIALRPGVPIAGLLLLAAVLADALLARGEKEIELERIAPEEGARDATLSVEIIVRNPLARAIRLELRESLPRDLLESESESQSEPAWPEVRVAADSVRRLCYAIRPRVRGPRVWGPLVAQVRSPLGLLRRRVMAGEGQSIRVRPETERFLRPEALDPRRVLAALGARPRRRRGDGLELDSLREYVIGDEPRRIDWRATARRGRPIVRTHRHEESRTLILAVDASRLMGTRAPNGVAGPGSSPSAEDPDAIARTGLAPTRLDHAIDAALALAFAGLVAGDRVGLLVFDRALRAQITPIAHRVSLGLFVEALASVQPRPVEADYRRLTRELLARQRKRAMVVVLTDFMELDEQEIVAPMGLLARRHQVVFVALREPILAQLESSAPTGPDRLLAIHRRIVLADLLREREGRLVQLRRRGLSVLDVPPAEATASTLNRFLELRYGAG